MGLSYTMIGGATLVGVVNEVSALWRDGKISRTYTSAELEDRKKVYVALVGGMIVGIPLLAAPDDGKWYTAVAEGAFDGLAAIVARNVAGGVMKAAVPPHVPL